jgi:Domain of unknown function (DUF4268)
MFGKEEALALKKEFWVNFAKAYPRKWLTYHTKIKDFAFKFSAEGKMIQVVLEIGHKDEVLRQIYYEKVESLEAILRDEFLPDVIFDRHHLLENGKTVSKIWVEHRGLSLMNKNHWDEIYAYFYQHMADFEHFYYEYQDYITDLEANL